MYTSVDYAIFASSYWNKCGVKCNIRFVVNTILLVSNNEDNYVAVWPLISPYSKVIDILKLPSELGKLKLFANILDCLKKKTNEIIHYGDLEATSNFSHFNLDKGGLEKIAFNGLVNVETKTAGNYGIDF